MDEFVKWYEFSGKCFTTLYINYVVTESGTLSSGPFSPSNMNQSDVPKSEVKEESRTNKISTQESILTVKNEIPWDLESYHTERRPDSDYNVRMDAKTILELCKYVVPYYYVFDYMENTAKLMIKL